MTQPTYNLTNIRDLLIQGFDDGELRTLCFDLPTFRPVHHQLSSSTGKAEIVAKLLEYAEKTLQLDALLELAKERNPARYRQHGPYSGSAVTPTVPVEGSSGVNIGNVQGGIHGSTIGGRDVHQTYNVTFQGGLTTGDQFNLSGDFRGALLNIKSKLEDVRQTVNTMPGGDSSEKAQLQQLLQQLSETLQQVPASHAEDAEAVAETAKNLVETASQERPNKTILQITGAGLQKAAENLQAVAPAVVNIATRIIDTITKLTR